MSGGAAAVIDETVREDAICRVALALHDGDEWDDIPKRIFDTAEVVVDALSGMLCQS